jgi:type VI secretion system secreted protein VgrG
MFEDKKGGEFIRMHAQKDYNVTVLNTETVTIGEKYTDGKISRSTTLIKGSDDLVIQEGNQSLDIVKGSQTVHIKKKQTIDVEDEISITAKNKITLTVGQSTITMEPQKIAVASPTINTESQLKTTIQGGAALDLLAALIKIN